MMRILFAISLAFICCSCNDQRSAVVFQSDFGLRDGAVNEMKAVAYSVDAELDMYDLTHDIPPFDIWEASYRLYQSASYWPSGTVFVSVVDPGVGTKRRSVVMKSKSGHYFVTPDNGTLHFVAASLGIAEVREIDEATNRRAESHGSYTFHGRDVYAYTAARLASGTISFDEVGQELERSVFRLPINDASVGNQTISGVIPVLDPQYGNVWTNIPDTLITMAFKMRPDSVHIRILNDSIARYDRTLKLVNTFGEVKKGAELAYFNSLMHLSFAINEGNFADSFMIKSGEHWKVEVSGANKIDTFAARHK